MTTRSPYLPVLAMAWLTFRATAVSLRGIGLWVLSLFPLLVLAGLAAHGMAGSNLVAVYEVLVVQAFLPLVLLLVTFLVAVPLFRDEIDDRSISYLITRTIGKPSIVLGKYLGATALSMMFLLPTVLGSFALTWSASGPARGELAGVLPAVLVVTLLGLLAYGAFYLMLGLVAKRALILGLAYAFFWEFLIGQLPGTAPDLSVMHYLLSVPTFWVSQGPLSSYPTSLTLGEALGVPLLLAIVYVGLSVAALWKLPLTPAAD